MTSMLRKDWAGLVRFVVHRFIRQECQKTAAALTYTTLFALVPLMTVAFGILSALPSTEKAGAGIQELLFSNLLPESGLMVSNYLASFAEQARNLTFAGVVILIVTAILMMKAIERAFNSIWSITEDRKGASSFLLYWSVLTLGPILMGAGLAASSFVLSHKIFLSATETLGIKTLLLQFLPLLTSSLAFMMLFHFVPKTYVSFKNAWLGGLFTAVCFELAKWVFTQFVSQSPSYKVVYGAFAAVPLFLLWIYISWNLVLLGATLVMALQRYNSGHQAGQGFSFIVALQVIGLLYNRWLEDSFVTDKELDKTLSPLSVREQRELLRVLQDNRFLVQVKVERPSKGVPSLYWQLGRDLSGLSQWQLLKLLPWPVPSEIEGWGDNKQASNDELMQLPPPAIKLLKEYLAREEECLSHPACTFFDKVA